MKHGLVTAVAVASALAVAAMALASDEKFAAPQAIVSRFSGMVNVPLKAGAAPSPLKIEIKDLSVVRSAEAVILPAGGFYIVWLKSGKIDTEASGKKEHRQAGDFWAVAAGELVTITFPKHSQAAQLQTIAIAP
jgi:hypothetical protein